MGSKNNDFYVWIKCFYLLSCFNSVNTRQSQIHKNHIGFQFLNYIYPFFSFFRFSYYFNPFKFV